MCVRHSPTTTSVHPVFDPIVLNRSNAMKSRVKSQKSRKVRRRSGLPGPAPLVVPYTVRQYNTQIMQATQVLSAGSFGFVEAFGSFQFRLSDITNFTKFTVLYDQYMLKKVEFEFLPTMRSNIIQFTDDTKLTFSLYTGPSYLHLVPDYDDFAVPATANEVVSRPNSVTLNLDGPRKYSLNPRSTMKTSDVVSNLMTVVPKGDQWIDCTNSNVDHLGLKYCWQIPFSNQSAGDFPYEARLGAIVKYTLAFRYPRL